NHSFDTNSIVVYHQQNDVVVNTGVATMATVRIFDIRGRLLVEKKAINASETRINAGTTNQVLLVQVTTTDGLVGLKKVIN
ncbi:T9SS sorting signal type C domain-containing protein, partial [Flavobacterium sp. SUN052]|uniref:T9SS sorting signal type C domain-containing protein n=1 Tax=Flavobacterium sp. SUN052 TaxID=3002441 RepID=UPI00237DFA2F